VFSNPTQPLSLMFAVNLRPSNASFDPNYPIANCNSSTEIRHSSTLSRCSGKCYAYTLATFCCHGFFTISRQCYLVLWVRVAVLLYNTLVSSTHQRSFILYDYVHVHVKQMSWSMTGSEGVGLVSQFGFVTFPARHRMEPRWNRTRRSSPSTG
jgi:hypothetical protein